MAKTFSVSRLTIYNWLKAKNWQSIYDDVNESVLDLTESQLLNLIKGIPKFEEDEQGNKKFIGWIERPSEAAVFFKLKTKGKKRGYIERGELDILNTDGSLNKIPTVIYSIPDHVIENLKQKG